MAADWLQQRRMSYIEAKLPVALHQQRKLFVLLEAGGVPTAAARWPDLHLLAFAAQADIMLTLCMCWGNGILEQFTWYRKERKLLNNIHPLCTVNKLHRVISSYFYSPSCLNRNSNYHLKSLICQLFSQLTIWSVKIPVTITQSLGWIQ